MKLVMKKEQLKMQQKQIKIPATYMRGGTSKGVFFNLDDLPPQAQQAGSYRDNLLLRVIGSPDAYGKQIDGMGGATSSTSKAVIVSKSSEPDHDVDYYFGQVSIDKPFVDWSGNCGNLTAAVGAFAIHRGIIDAKRIPETGIVTVRVWQKNIEKTILVHVPIEAGEVQELGDYSLDGVSFPAAEIQVDFIDPAGGSGSMFPTGQLIDTFEVPQIGTIEATLINAGIPTIFVNAAQLGYSGTELQSDINSDSKALAMFESIRAYGAVAMGLIDSPEQAQQRQHTPKIAFIAPSQDYLASSGQQILKQEIDFVVRALSMGQLHHAMMGTAAVAIASAACVEGTLVNKVAGGGERETVTFGHPSGSLKVGAKAIYRVEGWQVERAVMSRSARVIMDGAVHLPPIADKPSSTVAT